MPNHPRRASAHATPNPAPAEIKAARLAAGLSQTAAAALVYAGLRTWQDWEAGERRMHPGLFDLFQRRISDRSA